MDNLDRADRWFAEQKYKGCGINVDALSGALARKALKRLLGMAADRGAMQYIAACKEIIQGDKKNENHKTVI